MVLKSGDMLPAMAFLYQAELGKRVYNLLSNLSLDTRLFRFNIQRGVVIDFVLQLPSVRR